MTGTLATRPYAGEDDYARMRSLLVTIAAAGPAHYCTVGDLDWWRFGNGDPETVRATQLWFDGDELVAFAWSPYDAQGELLTHPDYRAAEDGLYAWIEARRGQAAPSQPCAVWAYDSDTPRVACLRARGYARTGRCFRYRTCNLAEAPPAVPLPPGYSIRNVRGEADLERRVAVHRAAFAPSRMTVEKHRRVLAAPTYRADLDLVVVAPGGDFAAYCLVWLDTANALGVFEPVGTDPAHQRRGLGKAVLAEGLRRLRALGARAAFVNSHGDSVAANRLYDSAGFRVVGENHAWEQAR